MDETRNDVRIFKIARRLIQHRGSYRIVFLNLQVVVLSKDVRWDRGRKVVPKLVLVGTCDTLLVPRTRC